MLLNITHKTSCNHLMQASQCSLGDAIVLTYRGWTWRIIRFCETAFFFLFGSLPAIGMISLSGWTWPPSTSGYIYTSSESFNLFCFCFFCLGKVGGGFGGTRCGSGGPPCWRLLTRGLRKDEKRMQKVVQDLSQVCISHHTHALLTNEPVLSSTSPLKCST